MAVLTALIAQGVTGDRLDSHLLRAQRAGLDQGALLALAWLLALYVGQPRASLAAERIRQVVTGAP